MFSLDFFIFMCVISLIVGALLGALISRQMAPQRRQKDLEQQLGSVKSELGQYQQEVAQHFIETSKLVNELTQSYKNVHEHLAQGAIELTNPEISKQVLEAGEGKLGLEADTQKPNDSENASFEPPKDWAPKAPGESGQLSEEFGLKEDSKNADKQNT